ADLLRVDPLYSTQWLVNVSTGQRSWRRATFFNQPKSSPKRARHHTPSDASWQTSATIQVLAGTTPRIPAPSRASTRAFRLTRTLIRALLPSPAIVRLPSWSSSAHLFV